MSVVDYLNSQFAEASDDAVAVEETVVDVADNLDVTSDNGIPSVSDSGIDTAPPVDPDVIEKRLHDKDAYIAKLGNELGELRKQVSQIEKPAEPQYDFSGVDEVIQDNVDLAPQIAMAALQQGDAIGYERAIRAWGEIDPFGALRFEQHQHGVALQQQIAAQTAPVQQQYEQQAVQNRVRTATMNVANRISDFETVMSGIDITNEQIPIGLLQGIENANTAEGSLEALYYWAKGRNTSLTAQASQRVSAEYAVEQDQQKKAAAVASASSATVTEDTGDDDELNAFYQAFRTPSPTSIPYR